MLLTPKDISQNISKKYLDKYSFEKIELKNMEEEEYEIKYQMEKPKKEKYEFENFINLRKNESRSVYDIKKESTIIYELLFLFSCCGEIKECELKTLYQGNINFIKKEIQNHFNNFKVMISNINISKKEANFQSQNFGDSMELNEYIKNLINDIIDKLIEELYIIRKIITDNKMYSLEEKDKDKFKELRDIIKGYCDFDNNDNIKKMIEDKINLIIEEIKNENNKDKGNIEKEYNYYKKIVETDLKVIIEIFQESIENDFNTVEKIIEEELIFILKAKDRDENTIFKINYNNYNFDLYYRQWENKITDEIKQNILKKLFKFFSILFRFLIEEESKNKKNILVNSFYEMCKLMDCLKLDKNNNFKMREDEYDYTKHILKYLKQFGGKANVLNEYFQNLAYILNRILTKENIFSCITNSEISVTIKSYIDYISFTYFSCLKIFDIDERELKKKSKIFEEYFEETKNDPNSVCFLDKSFSFNVDLLHTKFILMNWMYNHNIEDLDKVDYILNETEGNLSKKEEIEKKIIECIIDVKDQKYSKNLGRIIRDIKENEEEQKIDEKSFTKIFKSKIKYIVYRYKIKNGKCEDKDLEELKDDKEIILKDDIENKCLAIYFKDEKCHLSEIKVYLCIAEWYHEKYKNEGDIDKKKCFFEYLNFAFYMASFYNKQNINDYINYLAKTKYLFKQVKKNEDILAYKNIISNIKILCDKYNHNFKDTNIDYFIY